MRDWDIDKICRFDGFVKLFWFDGILHKWKLSVNYTFIKHFQADCVRELTNVLSSYYSRFLGFIVSRTNVLRNYII